MGLTRCTSCETIEGKTRELTPDELEALGLTEDENFVICAECVPARAEDIEDTIEYLPEHDDGEDR